MGKCETCGNSYDKSFEVRMNGDVFVFDCSECAIQALAPKCGNCGTRIVGHGLEDAGRFFCCARCVKSEGIRSLRDRT